MDDLDYIKKMAGVGENSVLTEGVSKKHFIAIADAIKSIPDAKIKSDMASRIGTVFQDLNPRFDWNRWNAHIGVQGNM